ncbi:MAG: mechanosensitive ion channel family protein [Anaerolineaceae bacterium]|nr:mechanosensitive ion channel family protein [Anaerolineaceae bacterium]
MLNILGFLVELPNDLAFLAKPIPTFLINMAVWIVIALVVNFVILRLLKLLTRTIPGDLEDIILGILNRPILILIGLYGANSSLRQLPLLPMVEKWINVISLTILVLVLTHITGRFIKDVLVYYGEKWAARTESRVDDVLIPILNLFGPLLLGIIAALIILPLWGFDITSVLLGAGVLGLVLGLALQETLGNIFSGISLLIEAPFRKGDLILLSDGRISEVMQLGMRSTMLFSLDEQATIYVPNKTLATTNLINLTKPTPEQRYNIDVNVDETYHMAQIQNDLFRIANGHPAVLSSDMSSKLKHVREQVADTRRKAALLPKADPARKDLLAEAEKNERSLLKLDLDGKFNQQVWDLKESLRNLIRGINSREVHGLSESERQELYCDYISPVERNIEASIQAAKAWLEVADPWVNDTDVWNQRKVWEKRNEQLQIQWDRLKKVLYDGSDQREMRLDDSTKVMLEWVEKEYKIPPGYWKDPTVVIKKLDGAAAQLQVSYYVDNIRLEHDGRPKRVRNEISRMIQERLVENKPVKSSG